jgi:allantoin racemase
MRIIVVNVNTSQSMTEVIGRAARRRAAAGTQIVALRPFFGPEAVDCDFEGSALDRCTTCAARGLADGTDR